MLFGRCTSPGTIDTGADCSLVSSSVLRKIRKSHIISQALSINEHLETADGSLIGVRSHVTLKFKLVEVTYEHMFREVDGLDFLVKHQAIIDLGTSTLTMGDNVILLQPRQAQPTIAFVTSAHNVNLKPHTSQLIPARLPHKKAKVHISPIAADPAFAHQPGMIMPDCISSCRRGSTVVSLINDMDRVLQVRKGQILGVGRNLTDYDIVSTLDEDIGYAETTPEIDPTPAPTPARYFRGALLHKTQTGGVVSSIPTAFCLPRYPTRSYSFVCSNSMLCHLACVMLQGHFKL